VESSPPDNFLVFLNILKNLNLILEGKFEFFKIFCTTCDFLFFREKVDVIMISDENNKLDDVVCCWSALIMRSETKFPFSGFLDQRGKISGVIKLVVAQPLMKCTHFARVIQQSPNELLIFLSVLKSTVNCYLITPAKKQKKLVVGI
jgi:hypothetical protein